MDGTFGNGMHYMNNRSAYLLLSLLTTSALGMGCASVAPPPPSGLSLKNGLRETVRYQDVGSGAQTTGQQTSNNDPQAFRPANTATSATPNDNANRVKEVIITGHQRLEKHDVLRQLRTRPGRFF